MSFHIGGDYAVHFGLDRVSNRMSVGGWSDGAVKYQLWDSRDFTSSNISNWSTAYSWGNHASAGYQSASTAITTSNIGSQSVSYATTSGSANSVAWTNVSGRPSALSSFTNDIVARTTLSASGDFQFGGQDLAQNNFSLSSATTDTDQFGRHYYSGTSGSIWSRYLPVDKSGKYRMKIRWKASAGSTTYVAVILLDTNGNNINGAGTYWAYPFSGGAAPTSWTTNDYWYDGSSFPSNAAYVAFGISHTNYGGGSATYYVSQLEIERYNHQISGNNIWHSGNLTNLNQLSNGPGYVTSSGSVNYATTAGSAPANGGNSSTVGGYSVSVGASANTIPTRNANGYLIPESWIQLNGIYGLYSPTNGAHLRPNDGSYGSWMMTGSRNSWQGIEFNSGNNGNVTLMINVSSNTVGFHNNSYGWQFLWESGTLYCFKNAYGGGTQATVLDSSNYSSWAQPIASAINTGNIGSQSVSYATTAGTANAVAWTNVSSRPTALSQFTNDLGNYGGWITSSGSISGSAGSVSGLTLTSSANGINPDSVTQNQIGYNTSVSLFGQTDGGLYSSAYSSSWIHQIYGDFRTGQIAIRGKLNGTWQSWRVVLDSSNYTSYAPGLTGSGASGTWGINISGSAGSVAWTNVSSRPTNLSQFTNDLGNYGGWQSASTAITTSNIGSQSVSYASTAGSAPANGGNSSTVGGYAVSGSVGANTVVIRDSNGYIYAHYINSNVSESENPTINSFYTSNGDGWLRKSSVAHVKSQLGLGSLAYSSATIPTNNNQLTNGAGYITGINSGNVTTALGFTPYNATNPSGYITSSASISGNAATATNVAWTGVTGRPTALSQFSNDLGNYGGWLTTGGKAADSELFDGTDSIYFVKGNGTNALGRTTTNNSGGNSAGGLSSGFYDGSGMSNMPTSDWYHLIVNSHHNSATSNQYEFQLATAFWDKSNFYVRSISPGDVGPWRTLIHNGNIGSQSVSYATTSQQLNKYGDISGQDWNTYYINGKMIVSSVYGGSGPNFPTGAYNYGAMLSYGVTGSEFFQVYFPENGALQGGAFRKLHYRTGWNGSWSAWKSVVDQEGQVCTIAGSNQTGIEIHSNVGYNQDPLTYFLMRGQADTSWKALKVRLTGDAGGQDIEFRRIAENGTDSRMWYVPRGANTVNFDYPIVQPSDSRLKDNITPISTPVDKIKSLRGVEFDWNSGEQVGTHDVGLIAQDVEAVLPEAVTTQEDGYKNLAYTKVIPLLVEAMKEQQAMIEALKAEIELLKNK